MAAYTTIDDPELYFQCRAYTGNGADGHAITFDGTNNMSPNLLWFKGRAAPDSGSAAHRLLDTVRGITQALPSHDTDGQFVESGDGISSVDTDGFTLQINSGNDYNSSSKTYVCWAWKESATAGFDILTFTGNASGNQTISHNLSAVPKCWHIKRLDQASNWCSYHVGLGGADHNLFLNTTSAVQTDTGIWNNTLPTSSVFSVGNNIDANGSGASHVWYGWSEVQGFSKFGKYTGNGNADGTFVYTGFRPAYGMFKRTDNTADWYIYDNKRNTFNVLDDRIEANEHAPEAADGGDGNTVDFLSNGFKLRGSGGSMNDGTFVYMAFAEQPFVNSKGVPANAR